jgi:Zn-dependent oligopeptidase
MELSGVGLEGEAKDRFNAIQLELAELSTKFSNNVLDATKVKCMLYIMLYNIHYNIAHAPHTDVNIAASVICSANAMLVEL